MKSLVFVAVVMLCGVPLAASSERPEPEQVADSSTAMCVIVDDKVEDGKHVCIYDCGGQKKTVEVKASQYCPFMP